MGVAQTCSPSRITEQTSLAYLEHNATAKLKETFLFNLFYNIYTYIRSQNFAVRKYIAHPSHGEIF